MATRGVAGGILTGIVGTSTVAAALRARSKPIEATAKLVSGGVRGNNVGCTNLQVETGRPVALE